MGHRQVPDPVHPLIGAEDPRRLRGGGASAQRGAPPARNRRRQTRATSLFAMGLLVCPPKGGQTSRFPSCYFSENCLQIGPELSSIARSSHRGKALSFIIGVLCVAIFTIGNTQAASAASYRYVVINKSSQSNSTGSVFASCKITSNGGTCTITTGKSVTRTIQVSLGASRGDVSAGLNISSAESVTTTVACASPALKAGQTWKARALGTKYTYNVREEKRSQPRIGGPATWSTVQTSGKLTAFNPYSSSISCGL